MPSVRSPPIPYSAFLPVFWLKEMSSPAGFKLSGHWETGEWGMSIRHTIQKLSVQVALKIIRPEISDNPDGLARFRREVRIANRITHQNVCRTFDLEHDIRQIGPDPGNLIEIVFLTMEYIDGETLQQSLKRQGRLNPCQAISIATKIAQGLTAAHQAGIVHRDIKPSNVMIVPLHSGDAQVDRVVITDFGLARFETVMEGNDASSISHPGGIMGTLAYMAPEQLRAEAVTTATDIYAFGLVLYEMVTGEKAFPDSQSMAAAFRRISQLPPSPRALVPALPSEWETAVLGCLQIDPASRFQRANDVVAVLEGHPVVLIPTAASVKENPRL
jgi:serine/threonine protein kinase